MEAEIVEEDVNKETVVRPEKQECDYKSNSRVERCLLMLKAEQVTPGLVRV